VAGVLVVALVAIPGVALAVTKPWQSGDRLIVGSTPTAQASASLSSVNPSASTPVGAEASSVPSSRSDTGLAPGAVAPSHSRSAAPRAVVPAPARLRVTVVASDLTPQVGQVVSFRLRWTDGNGRPGGTLASWGNGQVGGSGVSVHRCSANPSPGSGSTVLNHSWVAAGSYTVELGVTTYDCTGALETRTVTLRVTVTGAAVTPPSSSPGADPPPGVA
jgi:hypothetical protein